jgi:hypothetical protein
MAFLTKAIRVDQPVYGLGNGPISRIFARRSMLIGVLACLQQIPLSSAVWLPVIAGADHWGFHRQ